MKTNQIPIVTNAVMNTTINSTPVAIPDIYGYAIQAVYTGTPNGTLKLQASADPFKYVTPNTPQTPTNWVDIADSSFTITSAGTYMWNYNGSFYTFVRLVYTDASGGTSTAVLNANITIKGV